MPFVAPTRAQFFAFGLPAKAFTASPQPVASVDVLTGTFTVPGHGYADGNRVRLAVNPGGGGVVAGVLPAGVSPATLYYVVAVDSLGGDMFRLSLTEGGSAVVPSDTGTPVFAAVRDIGDDIDLELAATTATVVDKTKGMSGPFEVAPLQVIQWICQLAAYNLAVTKGIVDPTYAADPGLAERAKWVRRELDKRELTGKQFAGATDATPTVPENAAVAWSGGARWDDDGGIL